MGEKEPDSADEIQNYVKANVLMMHAKDAYETGEYKESIRLLGEAIKIFPKNSSLWFELAKSHREEGNFDGEITCYKEIIKLGDDDAETWLNLALAYRIIDRQPEEMYCLVMAADKGADIIDEGEGYDKHLIIERYMELTQQKVQARNPLSNEYALPAFKISSLDAKEQVNCIVCFKKIDKNKEKGQFLMCPHCERVGHFVCLASWLQSKQICPVCHGVLDFSLDNYDMKAALGIGKK